MDFHRCKEVCNIRPGCWSLDRLCFAPNMGQACKDRWCNLRCHRGDSQSHMSRQTVDSMTYKPFCWLVCKGWGYKDRWCNRLSHQGGNCLLCRTVNNQLLCIPCCTCTVFFLAPRYKNRCLCMWSPDKLHPSYTSDFLDDVPCHTNRWSAYLAPDKRPGWLVCKGWEHKDHWCSHLFHRDGSS